MKSMKLSKYFKLIKPVYKYIQITPHKSIRNYNSSNIAKAIARTYKSIEKRIRREKNNIFFECDFKISYIIDIQNNDAKFYFLVPEQVITLLLEKIKEIWGKATIIILEDKIKEFSENAEMYQLSYKKEDAMSLQVDKKSNEPLNSILSVMDIMKEDDRVAIVYNFLPCSQFGWLQRYNSTMEKIKEHKIIDNKQTSPEYIVKSTLFNVVKLFNTFMQVLDDFTGGHGEDKKESLYNSILGVLEQQKDLSPATKRKKEQTILDTQIAIISESTDEIRKENNVLSVCQGYRVLDEDNELIYKKVSSKKSMDLEKTSLGTTISTISTDEASNFIQIPGKSLLYSLGIKFIKVEEVKIPEKLKKGYIYLGDSKNKGTITAVYIEDDYNISSLPLCLTGSQGSGKSTFLANYYRFANVRGEGGVVIDFIKNCEMSDEIISYLPKDRMIILDFSKESDIQGFAFNELDISKAESPFRKNELANLQAQQVMQFINAINPDQPLQSRMTRYLSSAATIVFSCGGTTIKDVVRCLENHIVRKQWLDKLTSEDKVYLEEEIQDMQALDEWSKKTKDNPEPEVIGTMESKIEGILDRISKIRGDFKLKYMFNKSGEGNVDIVKALEEGKVIIIKMKQDSFKKYTKDVITTFLLSKIWMATEIRGSFHKKPKPTHITIDEVFQTRTAMAMLANNDILPQTRKFGCKFIFSCQGTEQIDILMDTLIDAGTSFMFLCGTSEKDFDRFKSKIEEFEYEDLKNMEKHSSLNLMYYSGGYTSFISKLPKPKNE